MVRRAASLKRTHQGQSHHYRFGAYRLSRPKTGAQFCSGHFVCTFISLTASGPPALAPLRPRRHNSNLRRPHSSSPFFSIAASFNGSSNLSPSYVGSSHPFPPSTLPRCSDTLAELHHPTQAELSTASTSLNPPISQNEIHHRNPHHPRLRRRRQESSSCRSMQPHRRLREGRHRLRYY